MKSKKINILLILVIVILSSGTLFANGDWVAKITGGVGSQETFVYEDDVVRFIEDMRLFQSMFPNPMMVKRPMTPEVLEFKKQTQEDFRDAKMKQNFIDKYIEALLFKIKAEELNYYSERTLSTKAKEFQSLMEIQLMSKVYIIKDLMPKIKPDSKVVDKYFEEIKKQSDSRGMMLPLDEIDKLASQYALEQTATEKLLRDVKDITAKSRIRIDSNNPFKVYIDGEQQFTEKEAESVFNGYLNLLMYVYQGGLAEESDMQKLAKDKDTKRNFIKEYINYHIVKGIIKKKGLYDERYIKDLAKRCTEYFRLNYINIRYAKEKILPKVEASMSNERVKSAIQQALANPEYSKIIAQQTKDMSKEARDQWVENFVKTGLYQQLIVQLKQEEIEELQYEYSIEYNH